MLRKKGKVIVMAKGFFSQSEYQSTREIYDRTTPHCGLCGLYKDCRNPKLKPYGYGNKKILIVAEAPGEKEDRLKIHLAGSAGKLLRRTLRKSGVSLDDDCLITNALICRRDGSKKPSDEMITACRPNLFKTIKQFRPKAIILLGGAAMQSMLPVIFKSPVDRVDRWADYYIPCQKPNAWITATYHPSFILDAKNPVYKLQFEKHIKEIIKRGKERPWKELPKYKDQIEVILNPAKAAKEINRIRKSGGAISFDYETNCLKSNYPGAKIYSCSISWKGKRTIAYPWKREAIAATSLILKSPMPKIAANLKFENVWTKNHLGHWVRNWKHDTMLAAHVLNNSPKVSSLTFQAFVNLGQPCYDQTVKPYLKSGKSKLNKIKDLDLRDLLLYNGLDSLLEYKLGRMQMKLLRKNLCR
jgi:uracil-DNA glycosylase family 4